MHPALVILLVVLFVQSVSLLGKERLQEFVSRPRPIPPCPPLCSIARSMRSLASLSHSSAGSQRQPHRRGTQFYAVYVRILHRKTISQQKRLRAEVFANKQQLAKTSSQDEFAKWAKLRRKVDKGLQDLEKTNAALSSSRSSFLLFFKVIMFVLTTVVPFAVTSYYGKTPIFWIPPNGLWFGPIGWFLSLPRAPAGSISSTMWQMVCTRAILTILSSLKSLLPVKQIEPVVVPPSSKPGDAKQQPSSPAAAATEKPASSAVPTENQAGARRRTARVADDKDDL
ncbi:GET complex subunit get1 [Thecaphora frezii]